MKDEGGSEPLTKLPKNLHTGLHIGLGRTVGLAFTDRDQRVATAIEIDRTKKTAKLSLGIFDPDFSFSGYVSADVQNRKMTEGGFRLQVPLVETAAIDAAIDLLPKGTTINPSASVEIKGDLSPALRWNPHVHQFANVFLRDVRMGVEYRMGGSNSGSGPSGLSESSAFGALDISGKSSDARLFAFFGFRY